MIFKKKLDRIISKNNSLLCVGLDPEFEKLPYFLKSKKNPQFEFNKKIIETTHDLVCAYKLNTAFYEARGAKGIIDLKMTCDYLKQNYSEIVVLLDAKRADIGNTNNGHASFAFDYLQTDAITLNPYLGRKALQPFLDRKAKGCVILCRTSNSGAGEFQDLQVSNKPLYIHIAKAVVKNWNKNNNCLMVVGATYPKELSEIRKIAPDTTFLIPGIGTQKGNLKKTLEAGLNAQKKGLIISSSRNIIFASNGRNFASLARLQSEKLKNEINSYRILV